MCIQKARIMKGSINQPMINIPSLNAKPLRERAQIRVVFAGTPNAFVVTYESRGGSVSVGSRGWFKSATNPGRSFVATVQL